MRPLYKGAAVEPSQRHSGGNAGLWYDKFCNSWRVKEAEWSLSSTVGTGSDRDKESPKLTWIDTVVGSPIGRKEQIQEFVGRIVRLVEERGGRSAVFATASRFVTGLGRNHPVENGFAFHPTLGIPYLPGSSVKGMVRAWAKANGASDTDLGELLGCKSSAARLSFLDAIPIAPVTLEADVMTPHYAGWSNDDPPGDWRSPTPIPFMVTAKGTPFLFALLPCRDVAGPELDLVMTWLRGALEEAGAGAKTALGYGLMTADSVAHERLLRQVRQKLTEEQRTEEEARRRATLSPLELELDEIARREPEVEPYQVWLRALKQGRWSSEPQKQRQIGELVKSKMQAAGKWREKSEKKNPEKDWAYQDTLKVKRILEPGKQQ